MAMMEMNGVEWHLEQIAAPRSLLVIDTPDLQEHLRLSNAGFQTNRGDACLRTAYQAAERSTRRGLAGGQQWALILNRFPECGPVVIPKPPCTSVDEIEYVNAAGVVTVWAGSPLPYQLSKPAGPNAPRARLLPLPLQPWPVLGYGFLDPVTISFTCGYVDGSIPEEIRSGILLMASELYKQRTESVQDVSSAPAVIRAQQLWAGYRPR